ncbi:MAG: TlpA family protein disulfide reductase [Flavobacteriales bacterium]
MNKAVSVLLVGILFFIISISVHSVENYTVTCIVLIFLALIGSLGTYRLRNYLGNMHWLLPMPVALFYPTVYFLLQYVAEESPSIYCFVFSTLHALSYVLFWYVLKAGKSRIRTAVFLLLTLLALIATAYYFSSLYSSYAHQRETHIELPSFSLLNTKGDTLDSKELFENKVVVLDFWTIHCKPCREALPMLQDLRTIYAGQGNVKIYSVNTGKEDSMKEMKAYLSEAGDEIAEEHVLYDLDSRMSSFLNISYVPRYCIIGKDGAIHFENQGFVRVNSLHYRQWFEERIDILLVR